MKRFKTFPTLLVLCATALALMLAPGTALASDPAPKEHRAAFEQEFLTTTIDHHFMGVKMGEICVAKGSRPKLVDVCQDIIENQSAEIQEMRGYLQDWYGYDKEPMLMEQDLPDLQELEEARMGEDFDVMVSTMFIDHHLQQIEQSKRCLRKAYHPELKDICGRQIETQAREIEIFEDVIEDYRDGHHRDGHSKKHRWHHHDRHDHGGPHDHH